MPEEHLFHHSKPFLSYLVKWKRGLHPLRLAEELHGEHPPDRVAIISIDVTNGFCREGALASSRVGSIVAPIVMLLNRAYDLGVRHFIFPHDAHDPQALEFSSYPAHCARGSSESEPVSEIKSLPFFDQFVMLPKNSIDSALDTDLDAWLDRHPGINLFIVVGDCTDICVYLLAVHLRSRANVLNQQVRIIVPADCVDTYDLPVHIAQKISAVPHDGDLLHLIFLYHMMLNGVEVVSRVE